MSLEQHCYLNKSQQYFTGKSQWNPKRHMHYSKKKKKKTDERNSTMREVMSENVRKGQTYRQTTPSVVPLWAHSFWMYECKIVAEWSAAVRWFQGWSVDKLKTVFLNSDWGRVSGLGSDLECEYWTSKWGDGTEKREVFKLTGTCASDTAGLLSLNESANTQHSEIWVKENWHH